MEYATTAITILVVLIVLRLLLASAGRGARILQDGTLVLRYPGFVAVVGCVSIAIGAVFAAITVFDIVPTTGDEVMPYLVLFFVLLGLPLVLLAASVRITLTDSAVRRVGLTGKAREIRWEDMRKVTFSATSELVLHSDLTRIRMNTLLTGIRDAVEIVERKLDPALFAEAVEKCEAALANMGQRQAGRRDGVRR